MKRGVGQVEKEGKRKARKGVEERDGKDVKHGRDRRV